MLPIGLLLLAAAGVAGAAVFVADANDSAATLAAFGQTYDLTTLGVFLVGTVVGVVGIAGAALMVAGMQAGRDRRRGLRAQRNDLREENERLRAQVDDRTTVDAGDPYPTTDAPARTGRHAFRK